ncbi:hypothetical protein [Flavobacterium sp.]|uniref:hypothetical protein n=1 Tax=Flavobacterium sp. TaxID=239 RepID=UPI001212B734|nr:hypothetical protein [Flavobacterium sp.]RZJ72000.1 MAG: hypothetical protein EOO49_08195 [Flavobacterium sp.]
MRNAIFTLVCLLSVAFASAQKIDFDKKTATVSIDGVACMKYESNANNVTYMTLEGTDIIILKYMEQNGVRYCKVIFVESNQQLTSESYSFTKKLLVEKLLKSNTLVDCALNEEKVRTFCMKYDEKVEDRFNGNNTVIIKEESRPSGVNIKIGR